MVSGAGADNAGARSRGELGSIGLVIGATVGTAVHDLGLDLVGAATPVLAPGFGAQGGTVDSISETFGSARDQVLVASSREILAAGPEPSRLVGQLGRVSDSLRR
jgi:orotidine-5'-phosphate decarboxylase